MEVTIFLSELMSTFEVIVFLSDLHWAVGPKKLVPESKLPLLLSIFEIHSALVTDLVTCNE